jgi:hypothetical protein
VAQLNDLVSKDNGILTMALPEAVTAALMRSAETPTPSFLVISKVSIVGILENLRNLILDWSLKLEADGIMGEGMTFTKEEKEKATVKIYNLQNNSGALSIGDAYSAVQAGSMGPQAHAHDIGTGQCERTAGYEHEGAFSGIVPLARLNARNSDLCRPRHSSRTGRRC